MTRIDELLSSISKPRTILHDEPVSQGDWSDVVSSIHKLIEIAKEQKDWGCPAIGAKYTRYPSSTIEQDGVVKILDADPEPTKKWPGTVWEKIDEFYSGAFFRISGGRAKAFGAGRQDSAIVDHVHKAPGRSFMANDGPGGSTSWDGPSGNYAHRFDSTPFTAGASHANVADETRPDNFTIEIYQRLA